MIIRTRMCIITLISRWHLSGSKCFLRPTRCYRSGFFTFSIPCFTNQLLQFKPTNAYNFIKITTIL